MKFLSVSADELVNSILALSNTEQVCLLDSCGVSHLGSRFLFAGIKPLEVLEISDDNPSKTLRIFEQKLSTPQTFCFFTIAYDFGLKLENIAQRPKEISTFPEPNIFLALFDVLIVHDYQTSKTFLIGNEQRFNEIESLIFQQTVADFSITSDSATEVFSNFTKAEYIANVEKIQELIRDGETYQTNLTQQFRAKLPKNLSPQTIFQRLRKSHPAPFASFYKRQKDFVVSISPERFFRVECEESSVESFHLHPNSRLIKTSPIKGTRPRGKNLEDDENLRNELLNSQKDRAENTMIVDLLRNDIGRVCEFGSVEVEKLCDLEEHPSIFHLVSTVSGKLRNEVNYGEIIKALFPCGSITGCPKIRTMQIIDEIETVNRGLSMGAIGFGISGFRFGIKNTENQMLAQLPITNFQLPLIDLSVAIRTMVIRNDEAIFIVGGGIVIDSVPEDEYEESLVKAKALFKAIGIKEL